MATISNKAAKKALEAILEPANSQNKSSHCYIIVKTGLPAVNTLGSSGGATLGKLQVKVRGEGNAQAEKRRFRVVSDGGGNAFTTLYGTENGVALKAGKIGHIQFSLTEAGETENIVFSATAGGPNSNKECVFQKSEFEIGDLISLTHFTIELSE